MSETQSYKTVSFTQDQVDEVENALVFFRDLLEVRIKRETDSETREEFKRRVAVVREALLLVMA